MATIFTENYSGGYGNYYEFKVDATESDVSTANNTSKVTAKCYVRRTNSSRNGAYNNDGTAWSITIDGTATSGTSKWDTRNTSDWQYLGTATKTITHNSDGKKTITISGSHTGNSASGSSKMGNASGSGSFTLTNIPRQTSITSFTVAKKSETSLTFNWKTADTIDYVWYSTNNGSNWTGKDVTDGTSGSFDVTGLSANTSYNCKLRVRRKDSQLTTDSGSVSQTTYAYPYITTTPDFIIGDAVTIGFYNPLGRNCTITMKGADGSTVYSGSGWSGTTIAPFNTTEIINKLNVSVPYSGSGTYTMIISYGGNTSTKVGGTYYARLTPTIALSSRTVNSITVTSGSNIQVSSTQYRIKTSSGSYGSYQNSATFTGLTPNTDYVVEVKKVSSARSETATATVNATTYQIATITAPNFNLGDSFNVSIVNPSGASIEFFMETLNGSTRDETIRVESTSAGTKTITLSDSELDMIYKKFGNGTTATVRIGVRTLGAYYDWQDKTCTLTGNHKTIDIKVSNTWKRGKIWTKVNGTWKRAVVWTKVSGTWKRGG